MKIVTVLLGYRRPLETKQILEVIRGNEPNNFMLFVDFPREIDNETLITQNNQVKSLVSLVDWDCHFESCFFDENLGPFKAYNEIMRQVFLKYDGVVFLEDDKLPDKDFLPFCYELLQTYKDDQRIRFITGLNLMTTYPPNYPYDYFFSQNSSAWGHATWKRTYDKFSLIDSYHKNTYFRESIKEKYFKHDKFKSIINQAESYEKHSLYHGVPASMEYYLLGPIKYLFSDLVIVPSKNLISDVGATIDTLHGDELKVLPKRIQKHFFTKTYNIDWPIKHPPFVMADENYNPIKSFKFITRFLNFVERAIRIIYFRGPIYAYNRLKRRIKILKNEDYLTRK